jgi:hypothetical protein
MGADGASEAERLEFNPGVRLSDYETVRVVMSRQMFHAKAQSGRIHRTGGSPVTCNIGSKSREILSRAFQQLWGTPNPFALPAPATIHLRHICRELWLARSITAKTEWAR